MTKICVLLFMILLCGYTNTYDITMPKENITVSSEELSQNKNVKIECYKEKKETRKIIAKK